MPGENVEKTKRCKNNFRNFFLPTKPVTTGWLFNLNYLLKAVETLEDNWRSFNKDETLTFFLKTVIACLQSLLPACDAQALYTNDNLSIYCYEAREDVPFYYDPVNSPSWRLGNNLVASLNLGHQFPGMPATNHQKMVASLCSNKANELTAILKQLERHNLENGPKATKRNAHSCRLL